jgi:pSer/pThr/pTyr-binding forkhead associated (FHA) protein
MSVTVPIDSPAEEIEIELDELPPGIGMLVVTRGPNSGSKFALDEPLVTAGRHPDSVIFLDDITVSRRHAEVRQVAGGYVVADVGSLNGTYLNRERVEESPLHDGDELQIGTFKLLFLAGRR